MDEERNYHFGKNEIKINTIIFILENEGSISESGILAKFKENDRFKKINQSTVNRHLNGLFDLGCIEKLSDVKKSKSNFWDVTNIEHLKNIRREFPNIRTNIYEKSIMTIFKEGGYDISKIENLGFYIKLFFSVSLFDAFLYANINELRYKSEKIYLRDEGYKKTQNYEYHIENFIKLFEESNPGFKIPNDLKIYQRHMSKEAFLKIFEDFQIKTDEMIKELEEAYKIFVDFDGDLNWKPYKILLDHFINHDIYKDLESPDESRFFLDLKEYRDKAFDIWIEEDASLKNYERYHELIHLEELKVYSEIIKKYKQPSMFYISDDFNVIFEELKLAYKDQI